MKKEPLRKTFREKNPVKMKRKKTDISNYHGKPEIHSVSSLTESEFLNLKHTIIENFITYCLQVIVPFDWLNITALVKVIAHFETY